jgi:hypothetical protein
MFLKMHVSQKQCADALGFYNFFQDNNMRFGFSNDPYDQYSKFKNHRGDKLTVSGGCTPFLGGLIKVIGYWDDIFDSRWIRKIKVSESWIGGVKNEYGEITKIDLKERLKSPDGLYWFTENEKTRESSFPDPEFMWDFLDEAANCLTQESGANINECSENLKNWVNDNNVRSHKILIKRSKKVIDNYQGIEIRKPSF